jgi:hypothetical protein
MANSVDFDTSLRAKINIYFIKTNLHSLLCNFQGQSRKEIFQNHNNMD